MSPKGSDFHDPFDDLLREANSLSDGDLERIMGASSRKSEGNRMPEPGSRVGGVVVDVRAGEVLVDLGGKMHGLIQETEFAGGPLPALGEEIQAIFERYDRSKDLAILALKGVRREVLWDELRMGTILEGMVTAVNKGGLTVEVKGVRAFVPVSQVELGRVDDLSPYVGKKIRCKVTSFDRGTQNIILSRRAVLEQEAEAHRERILASLTEGQVLKGTVSRITEHGAFIDLGGVDGLLPARKIQAQKRTIQEGQRVEVEIVRIDREQRRVSLDLKELEADTWGQAMEHYSEGEEVTGWVSGSTPAGIILSIEEGIEGLVPREHFHLFPEEPRPGAILKVTIASIDLSRRQILLRPVPGRG